MGMFDFLKRNNSLLKAIIVYPNKNVKMLKVEGNKPSFTASDGLNNRRYMIDQKAIYFFNKEALLFYHSMHSSPILIHNEGSIGNSMSSSEFQSIIESKVINELLEASKGGGWDIQFIATMVSAVGVVILIMQGGGLNFLMGGGG